MLSELKDSRQVSFEFWLKNQVEKFFAAQFKRFYFSQKNFFFFF